MQNKSQKRSWNKKSSRKDKSIVLISAITLDSGIVMRVIIMRFEVIDELYALNNYQR